MLNAMRSEAPSAVAEILLLADRADEISLVQEAADDHHITVVDVCPAVLSYLRRQPGYSNCPRPDLIILDLNLSNPHHCQMLCEIKEDPQLRRIPVIVMAGDDSPKVIHDAYDLLANAYVTKPSEPEAFLRVIRATLVFWLGVAQLPREWQQI